MHFMGSICQRCFSIRRFFNCSNETLRLVIAFAAERLQKPNVIRPRSRKLSQNAAFPTTPEGARVIEALRSLFSGRPTESRKNRLLEYAHALSHYRRHAIVRCLHATPGLPLKDLSQRTDMPPPTACRLLGELGKAQIVDLNLAAVSPKEEPEKTLFALTVA